MDSPADNKNTGKAMFCVGWIMCLGMLVWIFGNWEQAKINPNQQIQSSHIDGALEVILQRNSQGHYLLNADVNGTSITFLVDTGASHLVFTESQAKKIGLEPGRPFYVSTANGDIQVRSAEVDRLKIGDIQLYELPASINPHMDGEALLGMSALANLEWTQRGDKLIIRQILY